MHYMALVLLLGAYIPVESKRDCLETGELSLDSGPIPLEACPGSVIRFRFLPTAAPTKIGEEDPEYEFKIEEGSASRKSLLIGFKNEELISNEEEDPLIIVSHHHTTLITISGKVPFTLAYAFVPPQSKNHNDIEFGQGNLKNLFLPSHFHSSSISLVNFLLDRQEINLQIPGEICSDPQVKNKLCDPEYILPTIDTGNGRIGILTTRSVNLSLRKVGKRSTLKFMTGTRSRHVLSTDLKISGSYDLGERNNLSTILPQSSTPLPPYDPSGIQIFFMSINEMNFYQNKFQNLKDKLSQLLKEFSATESVYNSNCELIFNPVDGFRGCRRDCALPEESSDRGCGSVSVSLKRNITDCTAYSTQLFREGLTKVVEDLSEEFGANIQVDNCLTGKTTALFISSLPVAIIVITFLVVYGILGSRNLLGACGIKSKSQNLIQGMELQSNEDVIGRENDVFFEDWNKEERLSQGQATQL